MLATSNPHFPQKVLNFSFTLSDNFFSLTLFENNFSESFPTVGKPVIHAISYVSIDIGGSSHKIPLWMQINNNLKHKFIYRLLPKCGISNKFNIPEFSIPVAYLCGSTGIAPLPGMFLVHKYLSHSN
jgi:hypothetical protein